MDKLPPIPTPAAQRWREFRVQVLPLVMFAGIALSVAFLWKSLVAPAGIVAGATQAGSTVGPSNRIEVGLPILVSIPDDMKSAPAESVDLSIEPVKP